jgi:hypothetical protein
MPDQGIIQGAQEVFEREPARLDLAAVDGHEAEQKQRPDRKHHEQHKIDESRHRGPQPMPGQRLEPRQLRRCDDRAFNHLMLPDDRRV